MAKYRKALPQLNASKPFLTDGGLETTLIFRLGIELPEFAAFLLLDRPNGEEIFASYFKDYIRLASARQTGLILDTPTWRANRDWGMRLGYEPARLMELNRRAVRMLLTLRERYETPDNPMVISGAIGPRGDGYKAELLMSTDNARTYHQEQVAAFAEGGADMVTAFTMNYVEEASGLTHAAKAMDMPVVISFTVEIDGKLPSGQPLDEAVVQVDAETGQYPQYYMINCAHPTHFLSSLPFQANWLTRLRGIRANASAKSHAELDEAAELDSGNPAELAEQYRTLASILPHLHVVGGCCGTDFRHVEKISKVF